MSIIAKIKNDYPKPREQMTEADWVAYNKTCYKTWYKSAGVIVKSGDRVLVVQDKHGMKWSFPKGAAAYEDNEDPHQTAIRECYEETALIIGDDYVFTTPPIKFPYDQYYMMAAVHPGAEHRARVHDEEVFQVKWCTRDELVQMWDKLNSGVRHYARNN